VRLACCPAWAWVLRKALLPALLPRDASLWGTGAWDAWACARPAARVDDSWSARPDGGAGKSVGLEPDVPEPDASWLPSACRAKLPCLQAGPAARAPYTPDAAQSAEQSFVAEALQAAVVHSGLPVGPPWSALAAQALGAAPSVQRVLRDPPPAAVAQLEGQRAVAPLVPPEPRIEAERAAPEP
jgi:hypothetical protein